MEIALIRNLNLPNRLTLARVIMAPVFVVFMSYDYMWSLIAAYAVFTAATMTDYYDGKIARERGQVTNFGKLLDPVADKVLTLAAFLAFVEMKLVPAWMGVIIIMRELIITGIRVMALKRGVYRR